MKKIILKLLFLLICGLFVLISCEKDEQEDFKYPANDEELTEAVRNSITISNQSAELIRDAINVSYDNEDDVDVDQIAKEIQQIEGVLSATSTESGTGIVIKQKDGIYSNILVVTKNNEKIFIPNLAESVSVNSEKEPAALNVFGTRADTQDYITPSGSGKAIILAPFQKAFNSNLNKIKGTLEQAGYQVTIIQDENATVDYFKGSYLSNFDIVYVDTHGGAGFKSLDGSDATLLCTGEEYSENRFKTFSTEEQKSIIIGKIPDSSKTYFCITPQWIKKTSTSKFPNSWFFANACESYKMTSGEGSMMETLTKLGVIGYNGYKETVDVSLSNSIAEKMVSEFASGSSFTESSTNVLSSWGLKTYSWYRRIKNFNDPNKSIVNLQLFTYNNTSRPFFIIDPDDVAGEAAVIPEYGPVGTEVVYRVTLKDKYVGKVERIEFDIDNTGEHLYLYQTDNNKIWERHELWAPTANVYPRIDTFTFSAYDSQNNQVGKSGSATFVITRQTARSETENKTTYCNK